jgi:hypothetical protein
MDKVKAGVSNLPDDDLVNLIVGHKTALVGNVNFTTPAPSVVDYATETDPYVTAHSLVNSLDAQLQGAIIDRANLRPAAENATSTRASYVQTTSGGNGQIILTSGFGVQGKPGPKGAVLKPDHFAASMSNMPQSVDTMWDRQRGRSFIVQFTETPTVEASWQQAGVTTNSTFAVKNLVSGKKYYFRVCAVLGDETGPWADLAECMAP